MEVRAADTVGSIRPEAEKLSLRPANKNLVERAAEDERQRRLHVHKDEDD
ncbi:hypothetical protein SDRG_02677 [Saprolegnia diclina VS20]|uniref:Uncharacterized protein n=1 Tax=Saprolegnia diclina (strain VS20) TaxID=1156394 RepID=T0S4Q6_SAPDV|nr:hypothetical protein SDRG_02677 [Saprolegnia diclina VS20]EQC40018.1 hypothetical protein SDRG_02677 [Saprolegnia diclina VS20]|eukprot:XP_008606492.1 hypothetical protein SDRG_02677 [Saprolegnia diclina VS20]